MCEESCAHPLTLSAHVAYDRALVLGCPGQRALSPPKMEKKELQGVKIAFCASESTSAWGE